MHSPDDKRLAELRAWLQPLAGRHGLDLETIRPASDDASFRRYFRIDAPGAAGGPSGAPAARSLIAMDAPPPMEDCRPFVHARDAFASSGVSVPGILESDLDRGFLLLSDFGSTTFLAAFERVSPDALYRDAISALLRFQAASRPRTFPPYDRALLLRELMLYPDWYVARHKGLALSDAERAVLASAFETLLANNLAQPRVWVHRDYHSRNLMLLEGDANPGILDFQDAVEGPITYDLVSLLRDAYVSWPEEQALDWAVRYWEAGRNAGLPLAADFGEFYRDLEWMGLQRHLKVLGIFARLCYRDGKRRYLADMPRIQGWVALVTRRYGAFARLGALIEDIEQRAPQADPTH